MWESYYDTTSDIDQTETELFNWEHQTSPDTAPHSRRPLSIGPAPAYKYPSSSPPSVLGDKRSSPICLNKAELERQQEKASQQHQHHVFGVEMNAAQSLYAAIPTAIPIETSTYHGPDHQTHFPAATHPGYHSHYVQHPVNEQHAAHGLSTSAPEAGEPWNMQHHHQQQQSRAPNWTYPGMPGALGESLRCRVHQPQADASCIASTSFSGRPASSGDQAVMAQGVGLVRYTSEETVAELTKEEKVGPESVCTRHDPADPLFFLSSNPTARSTKGAEPTSTTGFEEEAHGAYRQREIPLAFRTSRFP
jgi:hypothetical protein